MNFLGHLYFSNEDVQLQYANLFGDFIKGSDFSDYPLAIQQGIHLHRQIDDYIDHHPVVVELMHLLYPALPRIAGIAIDLYFDHLLARNWNEYHPMPLEAFIQRFYDAEIEHVEYYTPEYMATIRKMKEDNWLYNYQFHEGLTKACTGLSRRLSFKNALVDAPKVFLSKEPEIKKAFESYMLEARPFFREYFDREFHQ